MNTIPYYHVDVFTDMPLSGNGLTVFTEAEGFSKTAMQRLTQEMRQFESIFLHKLTNNRIRAYVFTCEEELDFAGHPVLGAAATLHDLLPQDVRETEWIFELNKKEVSVITQREEKSFKARMNQGIAEFGRVLTADEANMILACVNLDAKDLYPDCLPTVVSTGLPYLLIPLQKNALNARIKVPDLEKKLKYYGAQFIGILEIPTLNMRTWDNAGSVEDVATGSLAGPSGAYLVRKGFKEANKIIQLNQGGNLGRPSQLFVEVKIQSGIMTDVYVGGSVCKVSHNILSKEVMESL
jgi:trans-2,3-dihydro-3-hydroxyanthranilate isomerase